AWATERRDVLCALFYLLAVLAYLRACEGPPGEGLWRRRWYWAALALAGLALLSKSMAVSLPVVLLVLDVYPLRRLGGRWEGWVIYVVSVLPVLGIVQNAWQIAADRYTYLASLGWAVLAGAGIRAWCAAGDPRLVQARRTVVLAGAAVAAVALGTLTWRQAQV